MAGMIRLVVSGLAAVCMAVLATLPALAQGSGPATGNPVTFVIGLDLSASNPLVDDIAYSQKVGSKIGEQIADSVAALRGEAAHLWGL